MIRWLVDWLIGCRISPENSWGLLTKIHLPITNKLNNLTNQPINKSTNQRTLSADENI
jgi:hypothetical protein